MSNKPKDVPVYLFTGFLEGGKTKFIQETLEDRRFCNGEKTLLLVCEEGEEEYAPEQFATDTVQIRVVEEQKDLTRENLEKWLTETKSERVVVEYNGMWMLDVLYNAMPENWMVYQEFMFADSTTFLSYNSNMRQLVYDKLKSAELVVFNRFDEKTMDKMAFHKIVRGASRRADIAYEAKNGKVVYDDIEDPLPFDLNAPIVEIGDDDFALFYRDMADEPKKYDGAGGLLRGGPPCDDLLRGGYSVCSPGLPVGQGRHSEGRQLDDTHRQGELQVPPGIQSPGPCPQLYLRREL